MLETVIEEVEANRITKYTISEGGNRLAYSDVIERWIDEAQFRADFTDLLNGSPFKAYRWETPPISQATVGRPFEFVLVNSPFFSTRQTDAQTYQEYFTDEDTDGGIVTFANLRGDATLVVPSPRASTDCYGHLAAFLRGAPESQRDAFWRIVGQTVRCRVGTESLWLSTAGGGVAWLHVRIDSHPKYYCYTEFKQAT